MSGFGIIRGLIILGYLFFQVLILKNAVLFHTAFCFFYIGALLSLPVDSNPLLLMLFGFGLGFIVDIFYDSLGLHAMACVSIMFARNHWLTALTPQGGYNLNASPNLAVYGPQWFIVYVVPLIFLHHSLLFFTEAGGFDYFWNTIVKILASMLYTLLVIVLVEYIFPGKR
jgi:hypothetical protein